MNQNKKLLLKTPTAFATVFGAAAALTGCGSDSSDGEPSGPLISNISTVGSPIYPGGQVQVHVSASSPSGRPLTYSWELPEGWDGIDTGDNMFVLTAPDEKAAQDTVRVQVSDGKRTREAEVVLSTRGPAIESWDLSLSADEPVGEGDSLSIAVQAYNRDGYPLHYSHALSGMLFSEDGAAVDWNVTQRSMGGRYRVSSTATDGLGLSATTGADVEIEGVSVWPGFGGDRQRTGRSPSPNAQGAVGNELWRFEVGGSVFSSPALGPDGTLYVGSPGLSSAWVYALDPVDGSEVWAFETNGSVNSSPAVGADGTVYVGSSDNYWETGDKHVYALKPSAGTKLWAFETGGSVLSSPVLGADGTVYVGSHDNHVYALNPSDGTKLWAFETGGTVASSPALGADGTIYVGSNDNYVYALNPADGSALWAFATGDHVRPSPAVGADGTVYVGSNDRHVYALSPTDGREIWSFETGGYVRSSPALGADGTVYVGSNDNNVYALNPTDGSQLWAFETGGFVSSSPAVGADGTVYVGSNDNHVYALNPADGSLAWSFETGGSVLSSPTLGANGTVYIASYDGFVYAIR